MAVTLNVFVKDGSGNPVAGARVTALTKNQIIDPPVRYSQGDGGCNLYYQGPAFDPPVAVSLLMIGASILVLLLVRFFGSRTAMEKWVKP